MREIAPCGHLTSALISQHFPLERLFLDDTRYLEEEMRFLWGILQDEITVQRRLDFIVAEDVRHWNDVRRRLDVGRVQLTELFDVSQNIVELCDELVLFRRGQLQPSQLGDMLYVFCLLYTSPSPRD